MLASCSKPECISELDIRKGKHIIFGDGGGFRGTERSHLITQDGCVYFRETARTEWQLKDTLKKRHAKWALREAEKLDIWNILMHKPGPVYNYIQLRDGDKTNKITWGPKADNEEIKHFYQLLRQKVYLKKQK